MHNNIKPTIKPQNPQFSSGPCKKRPGWDFANLDRGILGRSHRSAEGLALIKQVIDKTKSVLNIPADYFVALVPGSATGAIEMAMWNMLGPKPIDSFACDVFSNRWHNNILNNLKLDVHSYIAPYGAIPDLTKINSQHDVLFTWNGTTTGVMFPDGKWLPDQHEGLIICDATSAAFCVDLPWTKLDVTAFSWQKGLGGEGGHGMLVLSPKAIARLEEYTPSWPVPWLLSLKNDGAVKYGLFKGETLNTPSMLCIADALDALQWLESIGGLPEAIRRTNENFSIIDKWLTKQEWIAYDVKDSKFRSNVSVCLSLTEGLAVEEQWERVKQICQTLANENVAYDIKNHAKGRPGFRIWCGPTIESGDINALLPWLEWGYNRNY